MFPLNFHTFDCIVASCAPNGVPASHQILVLHILETIVQVSTDAIVARSLIYPALNLPGIFEKSLLQAPEFAFKNYESNECG